jgi:hypothetical protein
MCINPFPLHRPCVASNQTSNPSPKNKRPRHHKKMALAILSACPAPAACQSLHPRLPFPLLITARAPAPSPAADPVHDRCPVQAPCHLSDAGALCAGPGSDWGKAQRPLGCSCKLWLPCSPFPGLIEGQDPQTLAPRSPYKCYAEKLRYTLGHSSGPQVSRPLSYP